MANLLNNTGVDPVKDTAKWHLPLALLLIAALTVAVYWPVLQNGFIDFDDDVYVTINTVVRQGLTLKGLVWSFTTFHAGNWHPLTWISHMIDVELFDLNPMGHHATSLLLHTVNSLLLCTIFYRMTGFIGRSMFVALLFALHPLHVESVAWVAERKDVLSTLFWLLTMWAYIGYTNRPSLKRYFPVAVFFALGLLAKQMLVTLPLVLLLMDYWPLKRLTPGQKGLETKPIDVKFLLIEKIPLVALSVAASLVILRAHASIGALFQVNEDSVLLHSGNAFISYVKYIRNMFWPVDLALFYPFEPSAVTVLKVTGAVVLLAVLTGLIVSQRRKRPYLVFGWFWYLITLLPVIGFIRVGGQALADRYTYIPLIGLFIMIVWGGTELAGTWRKGIPAAVGMAVIIIAILSTLTVTQVRYWHNSYDLFAHALAVVKRNWLAHNNIGILYAQHNRNAEAIFHFQESVRFNPKGVEGFRNLGNAYQSVGRTNEAVEAFRQAVWLSPNDAESHYRLGIAYLLNGNSELAQQEYRQLLRLNESSASSLLDSIKMFSRK
ncbi:MAG: tetratricopeptide repeat protein [Desulfuromonadaceae bacterium]|nr:tetratricopeptide repeat protein [Desulfuromonadaceae bacterium]